jgi:hypothetical protein
MNKSLVFTLTLVALTAASACSQAPSSSSPSDAFSEAESKIDTSNLIIGWNTQAEVQGDKITRLVREHASACIAAGPDNCVVIRADASADKLASGGRLQVRGERVWLDGFRSRVAKDIETDGGKIVAEGLNMQNAELVPQSVDASAGTATDAAAAPQSNFTPRQGGREAGDERTKLQNFQVVYATPAGVMGSEGDPIIATALNNSRTVFAYALSALIYIAAFALPFLAGFGVWRLVRSRLVARKPVVAVEGSAQH